MQSYGFWGIFVIVFMNCIVTGGILVILCRLILQIVQEVPFQLRFAYEEKVQNVKRFASTFQDTIPECRTFKNSVLEYCLKIYNV